VPATAPDVGELEGVAHGGHPTTRPPPCLRGEAQGDLGTWGAVRCIPLHLMEGRWASLWAWVERCAHPGTPWLQLAAPWAARVVLTRLVLGSSPAFAANDHGKPRLERVCAFCRDHCGVLSIEDEYHVACECPAFDRPRQVWWGTLLRLGAFPGGVRYVRGCRGTRYFGCFLRPSCPPPLQRLSPRRISSVLSCI